MRRREALIGAFALLTARPAPAQQGRVPTVAILILGQRFSESGLHRTAPATLSELGWIDGRNVRIEVHAAEGRLADLASMVADAVRRKPDVIMAGGGTVTTVAVAVTREIPIVMAASAFDPIERGWAESYNRPGRNVTGVTFAADEAVDKQLELLKEVAPEIRRVALLRTRANDANRAIVERAEAVAPRLGLLATMVEIGTADEVEPTIARLRSAETEALLAVVDPVMDGFRNRVADAAIRYRLPTAGQLPFYGSAGFLVTYAADLRLLHVRAAEYVHRILQGANPGELPIERPTKFVLTLNLRTARAMGLVIPPTLLARADEVIE
jgi:putative ABC transport system substrate-binding protein